MSTQVVPELLSNSGRSWKDCSEIFGKQLSSTMIRTTSSTLEYKTIRLLPRQDFPLYGEFPKLDNKVLIECEKCGMVLLPCVYPNHCNNPNHDKLIINTSGTKATTTSKNNKPSSYIPPGTSLLKKKYQQAKNKKKSGLPPPVPPPPLFTKTTTPPPSNIVAPEVPLVPSGQQVSKPLSPKTSSSSLITTPTLSTSKHKKSKKSGRKSKEDEKVEKTEKSPIEVNTTKVVPTGVPRRDSSKSKEFQQIFFDLGPASEPTKPSKDALTTSTTNRTVPAFVKIAPAPQQQNATQKVDILQPLQVAIAPTSANKTQGNLESPSSVVYMPMSPVAVVNNVPVQFLQLPVLRVASTQPLLSPPLATQPIVVTIPLQNNNTPMYTSHPKPLSMSTRATRKFGSTYLLQNQRIDHQRNEIQSITNTRRAVTNSCTSLNTFHHRPNILKNSARSNVKVTVKRSASDKLINESKHIRLNDANGFILHSDVSESAEAPSHNNSVHDKVTFLNMK